jgi:ribosomal protein S18 acetylase RimI-like enzyme
MVTIERMRSGDEARVEAAGELFDLPPTEEATAAFLADERHHLLVAVDGDRTVGFVSGVELIHPDKGTEMLLYELSVDEAHRRQGIGRALVEALLRLAGRRGCYDVFVLTERDNPAALATYLSTRATDEGDHVMFSWDLTDR